VNVRPAPVYIEPTSEVVHWISSIEERERKEAQRLLDAQAEQIKALGATVAQTHVRLGRPDEEIVILAEEIGAGLIAIGSRGLGGMRRVLVGSVSDSVVRHAHCPVLVMRAEKGSRPTSKARSQPLVVLATQEQGKSDFSRRCSQARSVRRTPPLTRLLFGG
jgi:nucleotide-binding universal stress UspA family protein